MKLTRKLPKQYIYSPYLELHFGSDPNRIYRYQKFTLKRKGILYAIFCEHINKVHRGRNSKRKLILKIVNCINQLNCKYYTDYGSFKLKNNYYFFYLNIFGNSNYKNYIEISSFSKNKICEIQRLFRRNKTEKGPIIRPHNFKSYKNKKLKTIC